MKKLYLAALFMLVSGVLSAQNARQPPKYALVIGNGNYTGLSRLSNPVNDANDVSAALQELGFTVDKLLNGGLEQMETAVTRLRDRLKTSTDSYGFFFYAGHGVQSNGENFLIPVDASIPTESYLRSRALSVQVILDDLNDAGNSLNVVVLDACRDNPFGWGRSGTRGLAIVGRQPADSIIVYATSAGQQASDGEGRNGLFTGQLLNNLKTPGLEVKEIFNRTGAGVAEASSRRQIPAVYNQFFGTAYLGERPIIRPPSVFETGEANIATGALEIVTSTAGTVRISGESVNQTVELPAWGSLPIEKINAGTYTVAIRYEDGKTEEKTVEVGRSESAKLEFSYRPAPPPAPRVIEPAAYRLNSAGASVGTAFAAPVFSAELRGTYAPWKSSFFELGLDLGLGSGVSGVRHFSLCPFARYALFIPFFAGGGWYAGAGAGFMMSTYTFQDEGKISGNTFVADLSTGVVFRSGVTISYTLRTDFASASNKVAVGYAYRFK